MSRSVTGRNPVEKHRRDVRWKIVAPVVASVIGLVAVGVLLIVGVATGALVFEQVSVIMGILATAFIALPLALICIVPYLALGALAVGAGKLYARTRTPLRAARRFTERVSSRTQRTLPRLARPVIAFSTRLARWEHTLLGWQRTALQAGKDDRHE